MEITLNGEKFTLETGSNIVNLIDKLNLDVDKLAIERNLEIVPKSKFAMTIIEEGDKLEIVHFIGGGEE
ncbi:MAG: thiamine biosynthesis protein ThiS [Alphaproteobacteria bacterium]|nr:thiamine biosynthesis protein ThiS [Alphaproteobacteria bacterium]